MYKEFGNVTKKSVFFSEANTNSCEEIKNGKREAFIAPLF